MLDQTLDRRVGVVTGGARGIGAEICRCLASCGAKVIVCDILRDEAERVARQIRAAGHVADPFAMDVGDEDAWEQLADFVEERHGALHIQVNNAGILSAGRRIEDLELADWHHVMRVNVDGVFLGTRTAMRLMNRTPQVDGRLHAIVNMSSIGGLRAGPFGSAYRTSKAAVAHFTKCAALESAALGYPIRVNFVHPGLTETPMGDEVFANRTVRDGDRTAAREALLESYPLRRFARPEEIAEAVHFLVGPGSDYMTGSELVVDGGAIAR